MFKNEKGFSLVQIMVAGTVMAVMSAGIANMVVQQSKTITYMEDRMSHQNYKKEIEQVFADNSICEETLKAISLPVVGADKNVSEVKDSAGNVIFSTTVPTKSTYDQIKIDKIKVENVSVPAVSSSGQIKLIFNIKRIRTGGGGEDLKPVEVTRDVDVDASNIVTACRGGDDDSSSASNCLENSGGRNVGFAAYGDVDVAYRVPSDVKALKFVTNSHRVSRGGGNDCSGGIDGIEGMFLLNGKSQVGGIKIEPGKTLRFVKGVRENQMRVYYNNALVVVSAFCDRDNDCRCTQASIKIQQPVMACPRDGDFNHSVTNDNISVSYWK